MKSLKKKMLSNQVGQSTIEFIFSFAFSVFLLFFLARIALNYTEGYIIHYANFMASRAYLVFENNSNQLDGGDVLAGNIAREVFDQIYPIFDGDFEVSAPSLSSNHHNVFVGTYVSYERRFSIPVIGGSGQDLRLISESFLGRIPNRAECLDRVCKAQNALLDLGDCQTGNVMIHLTLVDNGC